MGACLEIEQLEEKVAGGDNEPGLEIPSGYEDEYELAGALLAEGGTVPRYETEIDPRWRRSELSLAWVYQDYRHIGAYVSIRGERVEGRSRLVGPRFMQSARRTRVILPMGSARWVVMLPGDVHVQLEQDFHEATWTIPPDNQMSHNPTTSTITVSPLEPCWTSTRTRGKCRGFSRDSHVGLCKKFKERLPPKEFLVGRVIWATLSPDMNRPATHIKWQMEQLKRVTKKLAKKYRAWILFRLGFAPGTMNWRPHAHMFIVLPLGFTLERCRLLSITLKREFDRAWRDINGHGIMADGWKIKGDSESLDQAIRYAKRHETHERAYGEWDRPWHEYGDPPEIPEHRLEVTAHQMQKVWAALCRYKGQAAHPWACSFTFDDVDPKLVLMLLLRVGVVLPQDLIDLYRGVP